ncbi:WD repeat-containing protein 76 [Mizuhopecten yessoensis]|uniref:WD repeat-containing protein 76 n=1 Tax=Mizuhopecten yessoensis TaxID=6573 RepID=A0A210QDI0_MIZYE|nr:WD repeat-containing protein 76 [Mizuhopecten yessoensis]
MSTTRSTRAKRTLNRTDGDGNTSLKRKRSGKGDAIKEEKIPLQEVESNQQTTCTVIKKEPTILTDQQQVVKAQTEPTSQSSDEEDLHDEDGISTYEKRRLKNIKDNADFFSSLGISEMKNELKPSTAKLKASSRGLKKEKAPRVPLPRRISLRLLRVDPSGNSLPPVPLLPEPLEEHPRKPSGPLEMRKSLLKEGSLEDHNDLMAKLKGLVQKGTNSKEDSSKKTTASTRTTEQFMKGFSKMRLVAERVAKVVPNRVFSLDIHPSEDRVLVVAGDKWGAVGLWDVPGREHLTDGVLTYTPHSRPVNCLRFSPWNSSHLYSNSYDGTLRVGDLQKEIFDEVYATSEDDYNLLKNFDFLSASSLLVSQQDGTVALVDRRTKGVEAEHEYNLHFKSLRTVSVHPVHTHIFATASNDGTVSLWDHRKLKVGGKKNDPISCVQHAKGVSSAYFSPLTGKYILATSMDNKISVFDSSAPEKSLTTFKSFKHDNHVGRWLTGFRASWHPRREDLFVVGSMKRPRQIEVYSNTCEDLATFYDPDNLGSVCSLNAIHPTRNILVGANSSGRLHVFM